MVPRNHFCEGHCNTTSLTMPNPVSFHSTAPITYTQKSPLERKKVIKEASRKTDNYMKCKERKSKQCAKLVQILINLSILNYYIMVLVRTCTVSSVGAVRRGNRPATSVSISWLYRCLLLLSRILCSVIFQKEGGNLPNISWPHSVFSTPFDRAEIWCRAPRDH